MAIADTLLTLEEYALLPDNGRPTELVRGRIIEMNPPIPWHGYYCCKLAVFLGNHAVEHDTGRVMTNDSGVITERDPDTLRGADVAYYSYQHLPKGPMPKGYLSVAPELIFEVRSPGDRWRDILTKVGEYLGVGVLVVCIVDPETGTITVHDNDNPPQVLKKENNDVLTFPQLLPGFQLPLATLFE